MVIRCIRAKPRNNVRANRGIRIFCVMSSHAIENVPNGKLIVTFLIDYFTSAVEYFISARYRELLLAWCLTLLSELRKAVTIAGRLIPAKVSTIKSKLATISTSYCTLSILALPTRAERARELSPYLVTSDKIRASVGHSRVLFPGFCLRDSSCSPFRFRSRN